MIAKIALIALLLQVCVANNAAIEFLSSPGCTDQELASPSCKWYSSCLQSAFNCPADSYPLGYGNKYCTRFTEALDMFTPMGKSWIMKTMVCLKKALGPYAKAMDQTGKGVTCDQLTDIAFDSHPTCYVESGFCQLFKEQDFADMTKTCKALWHVFDMKDLFQARGVKQISATLKTCQLGFTTYFKLMAACGAGFFTYSR